MENIDSLYQNGQKYPKCPKMYLPKLSAQAHKFGILIKNGFIGGP